MTLVSEILPFCNIEICENTYNGKKCAQKIYTKKQRLEQLKYIWKFSGSAKNNNKKKLYSFIFLNKRATFYFDLFLPIFTWNHPMALYNAQGEDIVNFFYDKTYCCLADNGHKVSKV